MVSCHLGRLHVNVLRDSVIGVSSVSNERYDRKIEKDGNYSSAMKCLSPN